MGLRYSPSPSCHSYLAKDTPDDIQILPEGFRTLTTALPAMVKAQVPLDLNVRATATEWIYLVRRLLRKIIPQ